MKRKGKAEPSKSIDIDLSARILGIEEATNAACILAEKIKEAKTLAGELASLIENLEIEIKL